MKKEEQIKVDVHGSLFRVTKRGGNLISIESFIRKGEWRLLFTTQFNRDAQPDPLYDPIAFAIKTRLFK